MVPLSGRRHRLYEEEIPEVVAGLKLRLEQLLWEQGDKERAEVALRCLHRLLGGGVGRPKYPKFSWDYIGYFLDESMEESIYGVKKFQNSVEGAHKLLES